MTAPQEILVRGPNWTGDWIMASPGFRALRAECPKARITLQIRPERVPLAAGAPWFDAVLPPNSHRKGLPALAGEERRVRRAPRFDLGFGLAACFSALLMRIAGVRGIAGFRRGWRRALLHAAVEPSGPRTGRLLAPRERHVIGLVRAVGCAPRGTHLDLFATPDQERAAAGALEARGVPGGRPRTVIAPGASFGSSRLWSARSFAAVGDALVRGGPTARSG